MVAVDDLSFEVERGETFALIGPNGAGKTTTLKMLLGLARPDSGTVAIGPERLRATDPAGAPRARLRAAARDVPAGRTVRRGAAASSPTCAGCRATAVTRALERVAARVDRGPPRDASCRAATRSGCRSRRPCSAIPPLLVLDEPTASLDPEATWEFRSLLEQLRREGKTILLCSHLLSEVERVADRVLILVDGRCAALEPLDDAARAPGAGHAPRDRAAQPTMHARESRAGARAGSRASRLARGRVAVEGANGRGLEALEALRSAGVAVRSFEMQRPTLEEMFLAVVRGERRDGVSAASLFAAALVALLAWAARAPRGRRRSRADAGARRAAWTSQRPALRVRAPWTDRAGASTTRSSAWCATAGSAPRPRPCWLPDYDQARLARAESLWVVQGELPLADGRRLRGVPRSRRRRRVAAATRGRVARWPSSARDRGGRRHDRGRYLALLAVAAASPRSR